MSVPDDKQLGFDPMLTDWLRKSNAQKETDAAFTKENLLKVGFFGPQSLLGQAWSAVTGLLDGTPNPVEQSMVVNQARIDTAKAGGSPEDIARAGKDVQSAFDMQTGALDELLNPDAPSFDWKNIAIIGLVGFVIFLILKEVL